MATDTIISIGSLSLTAPMASGTNIEFLNNLGDSGSLLIAPSAINSVVTNGLFGPTLIGANIGGGTIENFLPGDSVTLQSIEQIYDDLNVSPMSLGYDGVFYSAIQSAAELGGGNIYIAPGGGVSSSFFMLGGGPTQQIFDDLEVALFGTGANNATLTLAIQPTGLFNTGDPNLVVTSPDAINACFAAGTRILTTRGEIAVEHLSVGDQVITRDGEDRDIIWIGKRDIDLSRHPNPPAIRPIIIEAGAIANETPARRLTVSPDHALLIDGMLVQAKDLLTGTTIRYDETARRIRYYHVELATHDILFAEGAAAESYLDTGHRGVFDNNDEPTILHPDLMQARREAESCAPICQDWDTLRQLRARLAHRAWHADPPPPSYVQAAG
jgi:hypothetical protein